MVQGKAIDGKLRGRPKRWAAAEEKAFLAAVVRQLVVTGPNVDKGQVPWGQFTGIRHTSTACARRIAKYRLVSPGEEKPAELPTGKRRRKTDVEKDNQFYQFCAMAHEVFKLRQRRREAAIRAALERKLAELSSLRGPGGEEGEQWSHALPDEMDPLLALLPAQLRSVVPRDELLRIMAPEDFSKLEPGRLFMASDAEEERLHTELQQELQAFYDSIPVQRPIGVSQRVPSLDDVDMVGPEGGLVRVQAAPRRLRADIRAAVRGTGGMAAGQVASLSAGDDAGWHVAAAAVSLLAAVYAAPLSRASDTGGEPEALLKAHAKELVTQAASQLCESRVLHSNRDASLLVQGTRQAAHARDMVLDFVPPFAEIRGAEQVLLKATGSIVMNPRQRGWGGLMAVILTGVTSGHLDLSVSFSQDTSVEEPDMEDLDQFLPKSLISVCVENEPPFGEATIHSGKLLSKQQPLAVEPTAPLFVVTQPSLHLVTAVLGVPIADTERQDMAGLAVRSALGPTSRPDLNMQERLQAAVSAITIPLQGHLEAAGALPSSFVRPAVIGDTVCSAFASCMDAVRSAAKRAGVAGVAVGALLRAVVGPAAAESDGNELIPLEAKEHVQRAAVQVGRLLALRDNHLELTAMLSVDQAQWPEVGEGLSAAKHAFACAGMQV